MKTIRTAIIVIMSLGISAFADNSPYRFEYAVTDKDGTTLRGSASFLVGEYFRIPIPMNTFGMCVLDVELEANDKENKAEKSAIGKLTISKISPTGEPNPNPLFCVSLPITLGKDVELLKMTDLSVLVRIGSTEENK